METSRVAHIGDLLFEQVENISYAGVVYKITANKYNHKTAFIKWFTPPRCYNDDYGYALSNIHNMRRRFELVKA